MVVIKVENLYKEYQLGVISHQTLYRELQTYWSRFRGKEDPNSKIIHHNGNSLNGTPAKDGEKILALNDVSFEVKQGEVLGIIGKNGAGKSTLLKILSRITKPSKGSVKINGRISSLLEVGTGFSPDLTGRQNIFLNGAILGMTKKEIQKKFDEIVDFSGVERFIDTPVKRYSSGMYVRLAFAVAAHLEPEILIIDEVLAVGDAEFQKKCLGKMKDVAKHGRTVLFVSHNIAAIKSLCNNAFLLYNGSIINRGNTDSVISSYLKEGTETGNHKIFMNGLSKEDITIHELKLNSIEKNTEEPIIEGDEIEFTIKLTVKNDFPEKYNLTFQMYNEIGEPMFSFSHIREGINLKSGMNELICKFPGKFFNTGTFYIHLLLVKNKKEVLLTERDILSFTVVNAQQDLGVWMGKTIGFLKPGFEWKNN